MDADRGPEAGRAAPSESEAGNDGPQSNARSHPLRRMIGSEPPAAAAAGGAAEIDALIPEPAPAAPAAPAAPKAAAQPPQAAQSQPAAPAAEASEDDVAGASSLAGLAIRRNQPGKAAPKQPAAAPGGQAVAQSPAPAGSAAPAAAPQGANGAAKPPATAQVQNRAEAPAPAAKAPAVPVSASKAAPPQAATPKAAAAAPGSKAAAPRPDGGSPPDQQQAAAETPAPAAVAQAPNGAGARAGNSTGTRPAAGAAAKAQPTNAGAPAPQSAPAGEAASKTAVSIRKQPEPAPEVNIRKAGNGVAAKASPDQPAPTEAMKPSASIRKAPEKLTAEAAPAAAAQAEAPKPVPQAPASQAPAPEAPASEAQNRPAPAQEAQASEAAPAAAVAPAKAPAAPTVPVAVKAPQPAPPVEEARQVETPTVRSPAPEAPAVQTPAPEAPAAPPPAAPAPPPAAEALPELDLTPTDDLVFDEDGAMRIGYITSVSGRKVYGVMIPDKDVVSEESMLHLQEVSQIGDLVKMPTSKSVAFGMISSLEIRNPSSSPPAATDQRVLEIDLFGEGIYTDDGEFKFQRGISVYPSLGTEIRETTHNELAQIYARPSESNVLIGSLYQDSELPAYLLVDDLLGKHFAVLGTTGTGKSCSTTVILRSILDAHPNGHVVLMDPHNEYGQAFDEYAEVVRPDTLSLPFWLLNFEELVEVICTPDQTNRKAEVNILKEAVYASKLQFVGDSDDVTTWLTVDTPVPYRLSTLIQLIEDAQGQLDRPEDSAPYARLKARIQALRADRRYDFMFAGLSVKDSMAEVLARLLRIPVEGRPITILQLSGVPSEIVDVVVSLLCRMVFDFAMWSMGQQSVPVLLVCEEAHRYIPQDQDTGFAPTRKAIARIAKEGRKYGVSLCLVTQRPSELSETILSQCNTIFTLRMSNERDQVFVRRAMPDSAAGMLNALPALRNQECIVVGEGVSVPMRIRFLDLEPYNRPQSDTAVFSDAWEYDQDRGESFLHDVVDRWRRQSF